MYVILHIIFLKKSSLFQLPRLRLYHIFLNLSLN